jgi:hypothetical protein
MAAERCDHPGRRRGDHPWPGSLRYLRVVSDETATPAPPATVLAFSALRIVGSATILVTLYYTTPFDRSTAVALVFLAVGLCGLVSLLVYQVRRIGRSHHPGLRAVEGLAVSLPLFLLIFAGTYFDMERLGPGNFTQPLSKSDALYFTVSTFGTVGFGDIAAKTEGARLLVTGQMVIDLVILGVGARIIVSAVQRAQRGKSRSNAA